MTARPKSVAIIGSGASGTILASQIVENAHDGSGQEFTVYLIEKGDDFGPGLAYSTPLSSHILNMRADTLGVMNNDPLDFSKWFERQCPGLLEADPGLDNVNYPPRHIYGTYIKHILDSAIHRAASSACSIHLVKAEAVDLDLKESGFQVKTADGKVIDADKVVLAPGNFPASSFEDLNGTKGYIPYPWPVSRITDSIPKDVPVCILGSGLSAIDTFFTLTANDHRGNITFISRQGVLPKVQGVPSDYDLKYLNNDHVNKILAQAPGGRLSLDQIQGLFSSEIGAAEDIKDNWLNILTPTGPAVQILEKDISKAKSGVIAYQSALTAAAQTTVLLWNSMTIEDRMRFDRDFKTLWTVYRHPMPLVNAQKIYSALASGQLDIQSGCRCVRACGEKNFEIDVRTRFGLPYTIKTPYIINAIGQGLDVTKFKSVLIGRLLHKGLIEPHPNGGIYADFVDGEVLNHNGRRTPGLYAVGEITRGVHFFTNGIVPNMAVSKRVAAHMDTG